MASILNGSGLPVSIGPGYALRTPGWRGSADLHMGGVAATRSAVRGLDAGMDALDAALGAADLSEVRRVDLSLQAIAPGATGRSGAVAGPIELEVPDPGPDDRQLLLEIDDAGVLHWHLPEPAAGGAPVPASRGGGGTTRFRLAPPVPPAPAGAGPAQRSVLGAVGRKLLKLLVYPVTDPVLGVISEHFVNRWEDAKRPHGVRRFTPGHFRQPHAQLCSPGELAELAAKGRVLLFIHGTFSSSHAGFGALPPQTLGELDQRYGGRVLAFDHPSVGVDPTANARWLLQQLPESGVDLDIVCHSRGGLVSRVLAEAPHAPGMETGRARVHRLVFGASPNSGTLLADPDHMVSMVDRLTTLLTLFPTGPVTETLEALVTVLKVLAHGALKGLDGLACMRPEGDFLKGINGHSAAGATYYAISADYSPVETGLQGLVAGGKNLLVDAVFGDAGNDLVVPTEGVFASNGGSRFPIAADNLLVFDAAQGVTHTTLFQNPKVSERLLQWLN